MNDIIVAIVVPLVALLIGKAFAWLKEQKAVKANENYAAAVEALEVGVQEVWDNYGKEWKNKSGDGKYTDVQRSKLRDMAVKTAMVIGKARGVNVASVLATRGVNLLIKKIVDRRKRGNA